MRNCTGLFVLTVTLAASSCDRSPTSPPVPPGGGPTLSRISVSGPTLIAPGETGRYTATAHYSDGSSRDVTTSAIWTPSNPSQTAINFISAGEALAVRRGESPISASFEGKRDGFAVLALEVGTFKLSGVVSESGGGSLSGVTVDVVTGIGQGLRAITGQQGQYTLYGVAGPLQLRAWADGFTPQVHEVVVTGNDANERFALVPLESTADVSGTWTMTVAASSGCRAGLPEVAQGRTYQVQLTQQGTKLKMKISSPTLGRIGNPDLHTGSILGAAVRLLMVGDTGYGEWSTPDFYDHLSPTERFGFNGIATGSVNNAEIRTAMYGDLVYWNAPTFEPTWYCRSTEHVLTLRR